MRIWLLIIMLTQPNSGGANVQQFGNRETCEAAGSIIEQAFLELDPHPIRGRVNWRCVEVPVSHNAVD